MPWFRKSFRLRKKHKIRKKDISEPTDFKHCYHATFDVNCEEFTGLPQQWSCLVSPPATKLKEKKETPVSSPKEKKTTIVARSALDVKRPSPIVRGSDCCLEETIKYIRKHYRSLSSPENELEEEEEEFLDIHFGSRTSSLLQLGSTSGMSRANVVSYTSSSTSRMSRSNDPLPSASFCLSAPNNIVRSDLGLYHSENASESGTHASHSRINSPSESSGYFGSTLSSLYSSRMSSTQHITSNPSSHHPNPIFSPNRPLHPYESHEAWIHPQMHHNQHRFSSLQRPVRYHRDYGPHSVRPHPLGPGTSALANFSAGHYGTAPRTHNRHGNHLDGCRAHERADPRFQLHHNPVLRKTSSPLQPTGNGSAMHLHKRERRRMSNEQFRATMELLVNPGDPRRDLTDFVKIGEGSTGLVYTARQISQDRLVAVKKMSLWKQQRRELLFNEVSKYQLYVVCDPSGRVVVQHYGFIVGRH